MSGFLYLADIFLQSGPGWRLDFLSLLIGMILGGLLATAAIRLGPTVMAIRDRALGRVQAGVAWLRSSVEVRYNDEMAAYLRQYHLGGDQAPLDQVFVEPRLLAPLTEVDPELPFDFGPVMLHTLWPELAAGVATPPVPAITIRQLLLRGRRVILSAEPGAGKTTLLAYCAHACATASDMGPYTFLIPMLPAFVHLGELGLDAPEVEVEAESIAPISRALQARTDPLTSRGIDDLLRRKAAAGQVLLLLDGWDELPAGRRLAAVDWLRHLLIAYPDIQVVMAAPLRGYGPLLELDFVLSGLLPWRVGQVESLTRAWTEAAGVVRRIPIQTFWRPGQSLLETTLRLRLVLNSQDNVATPARWVDLLEVALRGLLPAITGEAVPPWLAPASRELWQQVAYRLLADGRPCLPQEQVMAIIDTILADYDVQEERQAPQRLYNTLLSNGLSIFWPNQGLAFLSPVWRDFLAAAHIAQSQLLQELADHVNDPHWAGVLRFYAGRTGGDEIAPLVLDGRRADPLSDGLFQVAAWLSETAPASKGEWRRQSLIRLGQMIVKANLPATLRQRAAVALARTGEGGVLVFLRQLLQQRDPVMRQVALAAIARLGAEITMEAVDKMTADQDARVRAAAIHALAWVHDPATEKPLLTALVDEDEPTSRAAAEGLALNNNHEANEVLREAIAEDALHVRRAAVLGLSLLDQFWSVDLLDRAEREDDEWVVKSAATSALETIVERNRPGRWRILLPGDHPWLISWAAAQARAVPGGAAAMPVLLEALAQAEQTAIRTAAVVSLGQMAAKEAIPALQAALRDEQAQVREAAFISLCQIGRAWDIPIFGPPPSASQPPRPEAAPQPEAA
ncbi:MAG: HEAT repeat domain-containing protein [Chloroflexi bacterium]|nr:HEAT repeat domain-containing protein [Chloroflexota bacterium]MCI0580532.1 HEAT repeat domain-containing protein [Chloroflexota bacterium]MCI0648117.1 HEAT repeat domain-containing protein [Chloroflexota bacterium]MCI0725461.1 HEAT repeat domain-containing protein [Chloroflexota bacterium]